MRRVAIAAVVAFGLVAAAPAATAPPKVTVSGKIVRLAAKSVTIHGARNVTCRLVTIRPHSLGFRVGLTAKVTCKRGVLVGISGKFPPKPASAPSPQPSTAPGTPGADSPPAGPAPSETPAAPSRPTAVSAILGTAATAVTGRGTITALGGGSVSFGSSVVCTIGSGSPSVGGFQVGAYVSFRCEGAGSDQSTIVDKMRAGAFVLTEIASAA